MQGVIVSFDPTTEIGSIMTDTVDRAQYPLAPDVMKNSIFTVLRQGQRVNFDLDEKERAINVRIGSEVDMGISTARV
ncbi:MAG TPA: hypothetical protein PKB15_01195 [Acidimicrobiia bacterium]|nr:hypothetical protein [Acidimicrobiia bacterium]